MSEDFPSVSHLARPLWRGDLSLCRRYDNPLYQRIVGLDEIPVLTRAPKGPRVEISVVTDNVLQVDEKLLGAVGHKLFVLNALLINLGLSITRHDVEKLGFAPDASSNVRQKEFSLAKRELQEELIYGQPPRPLIYQKFGSAQRAHFQLEPRLEYVFYDRRVA